MEKLKGKTIKIGDEEFEKVPEIKDIADKINEIIDFLSVPQCPQQKQLKSK